MKAAAVLAESPEYRPSEDEEFMNERQLEYFKQKLLDWKEDILRESRETVALLSVTLAPRDCSAAADAPDDTDAGAARRSPAVASPTPALRPDACSRRLRQAEWSGFC